MQSSAKYEVLVVQVEEGGIPFAYESVVTVEADSIEEAKEEAAKLPHVLDVLTVLARIGKPEKPLAFTNADAASLVDALVREYEAHEGTVRVIALGPEAW
jgi:hypothetical protein